MSIWTGSIEMDAGQMEDILRAMSFREHSVDVENVIIN